MERNNNQFFIIFLMQEFVRKIQAVESDINSLQFNLTELESRVNFKNDELRRKIIDSVELVLKIHPDQISHFFVQCKIGAIASIPDLLIKVDATTCDNSPTKASFRGTFSSNLVAILSTPQAELCEIFCNMRNRFNKGLASSESVGGIIKLWVLSLLQSLQHYQILN